MGKNYVVITDEIAQTTGLTGNELMVYATIYGFTQGKNVGGGFFGSLRYLNETLNMSKATASRTLKSLESKGFIKAVDVKYVAGNPQSPTKVFVACELFQNGTTCSKMEQLCSKMEQVTPVSIYKDNINKSHGSAVARENATKEEVDKGEATNEVMTQFPGTSQTLGGQVEVVTSNEDEIRTVNLKKVEKHKQRCAMFQEQQRLLDEMGLKSVKPSAAFGKLLMDRKQEGYTMLEMLEIARYAGEKAKKGNEFLSNPMYVFQAKGFMATKALKETDEAKKKKQWKMGA